MTYNDCTRNILNIEDLNINFYENFVNTTELKKGIKYKVFNAYLTYTPDFCPICGCVNESNSIIKWGWKKNCKIKIPKVSNYLSILNLDKQRFKCKNCNRTFIASTCIIDKHKQISKNLELSVKQELTMKSSEKDISFRQGISVSSTNRILDSVSNDLPVKRNGSLPEYIGIDEFKATKDTKSKMAFIIVDHKKHDVFDILNSRYTKDIFSYFLQYPQYERKKVKVITMDLYKPYYKLAKKLFPNAIIVPDRFHIVIQIRNILDQYRISLCKKSNPNYNKFKKYWKLILKDENDLNNKDKNYSNHFRKRVSQYDIVNYLINTNQFLKSLYNIYQGILHTLKVRDSNKFWNILTHISKDISKKLNTTINTFLSMKKYIDNAFTQPYSNGIVEGTNNFIKSIIRISYGFKKFRHLKARVMLCKGYYNITY